MKQYQVRRTADCPTGVHVNDAEETVDCTCPWLTVVSDSPVPHAMQWGRRELEVMIREFDRGYFDPQDYPARRNSMFISAHIQDLIRLAEQDPVSAVLRLLQPLPVVGLAWCELTSVLSWQLRTLPGQAQDWAVYYPPGVEVNSVRSNMPGGLVPRILWQAPTVVDADSFDVQTQAAIRGQVRAITADLEGDWSPAVPDVELVTTGEQEADGGQLPQSQTGR